MSNYDLSEVASVLQALGSEGPAEALQAFGELVVGHAIDATPADFRDAATDAALRSTGIWARNAAAGLDAILQAVAEASNETVSSVHLNGNQAA